MSIAPHPIEPAAADALARDSDLLSAVLHDVLEDTGTTPDDLRRLGYPEREVLALVALTKRSDEDDDYAAFIERVRGNPLAATVKRADLEDNMDVRRLAEFGAADAGRI